MTLSHLLPLALVYCLIGVIIPTALSARRGRLPDFSIAWIVAWPLMLVLLVSATIVVGLFVSGTVEAAIEES